MSLATCELLSESFGETSLLSFPGFDAIEGFSHAITTTPWNMAPHRGPDAAHAVERRRRICQRLGFEFERLTAPDQIHSPHVVRVTKSDIGAGRLGRDSAVRFVDGLVCDIPRVPLLQLSADCLLILAVDPNRRAFGTAHASWRGTVGGVARNLVRMMVHSFETRPADLLVGLAPSACPPRYEIGEDVRRVAEAMLTDAGRFMPASPSGRHCFDLKAANADQLLGSGVPAGRIVIAAECTMADPRFYSHRRDGDTTGRFALIAGFTA